MASGARHGLGGFAAIGGSGSCARMSATERGCGVVEDAQLLVDVEAAREAAPAPGDPGRRELGRAHAVDPPALLPLLQGRAEVLELGGDVPLGPAHVLEAQAAVLVAVARGAELLELRVHVAGAEDLAPEAHALRREDGPPPLRGPHGARGAAAEGREDLLGRELEGLVEVVRGGAHLLLLLHRGGEDVDLELA
eukprot:9438711-Lingulodinium_polyedra.AAC.1